MRPLTRDDIKWGSYQTFEGPYFPGRWKYTLPIEPTQQHRLMSVITATEGGTYDAVNMYDVCVMTVGIVQWCDKFHLVSKMLGYIADHGGIELITKPLENVLRSSGATFKKNRNGQWRFYIGATECSTVAHLQQLYFKGSTGRKGEWTPVQRSHAIDWALAMANIWNDERARELQVTYTADRVSTFAMQDGKRIILNQESWDGYIGAMKAIYISYAANNPKVANLQIKIGDEQSTSPKFSRAWVIELTRQLVFGSGIEIWPERYDKIRPVIEKLYGVSLPIDHQALSVWKDMVPMQPPVISEPEPTEEAQPVRVVDQHELPTNPNNKKPSLPPPTTATIIPEKFVVKQRMTFFDALIGFLKMIFTWFSRGVR